MPGKPWLTCESWKSRVELNNESLCKNLAERLETAARGMKLRLMEVCGTHTSAIFRYGLKSLLPSGIRLVSGPGCPVCVTPPAVLDRIIAYSRLPGVTVAVFGDMLKVPGSDSSLQEERARGGDVRLIYSPMESLAIARCSRRRKVILLGVGFETTAAPLAAVASEAYQRGQDNFFFLSALRRIIPAMEYILRSGPPGIDGFICPGHVSTVLGLAPYRGLSRRFGVPCVIAGFEPAEILSAILELVLMIRDNRPAAANLYPRVVSAGGNPRARKTIEEVFRIVDAPWRGMGVIAKSGYSLRKRYEKLAAEKWFPVELPPPRTRTGCLCGEVVRGAADPADCPFFGRGCNPSRPLGPCMVSAEGSCAAWFRYSGSSRKREGADG